MITNPEVFDRDHVPNLVCREEELTVLENALRPVTNGDPAEDVLLHGPFRKLEGMLRLAEASARRRS